MIVVIDPGNFSTKYFYEQSREQIAMGSFSSMAHEYIELADDDLSSCHGEMNRVQYLGLDKYIGEDVKHFFESKKDEDVFTGSTIKGHFQGVLRVVLALYKVYQETGESQFDLVATSPVKSRKRDKLFFEDTLTKHKTAVIDNEPFSFSINSFLVAAEGLGAKAFVDHKNCIIVDAGSQTTNVLRFVNEHLTEESSTINVGTQNVSEESLVDTVFRQLKGIDLDYPIRVSGGKAQGIAKTISRIGFQNCVSISAGCEPYFINGYGTLKKVMGGVGK